MSQGQPPGARLVPALLWEAIEAQTRGTLVSLWATLIHQALRAAEGEEEDLDRDQSQSAGDPSGSTRRRVLASVDDEAGSRESRVHTTAIRACPTSDGARLAVGVRR